MSPDQPAPAVTAPSIEQQTAAEVGEAAASLQRAMNLLVNGDDEDAVVAPVNRKLYLRILTLRDSARVIRRELAG